MKTWLTAFFFALALALAGGPSPAAAQTVPPPASEREMLQYLKDCPLGHVCRGRVTIPDQKSASLVQDEGRTWQEIMQGPVRHWGGWFLVGVLAALGAFYLVRGRIRVEGGLSGRKILRFDGFERFTHWLTATSFIVLGLTGLNIRFGRSLLLPLIGEDSFAWFSQYAKYAHDYTSFAFMLGIGAMMVMWIGRNWPNRDDVAWLKAGGGLLKPGTHVPAGKFNAGQKAIFWASMLLGGSLAATGLMLMFPFALTGIAGMQIVTFVHSILALGMIGVIFGHIYIGTLGMQGAFSAMANGQVDLKWAEQHHDKWVQELTSANMPRPRRSP